MGDDMKPDQQDHWDELALSVAKRTGHVGKLHNEGYSIHLSLEGRSVHVGPKTFKRLVAKGYITEDGNLSVRYAE